MFSVEELKRRKIVQWALAYLAGAFAALQLLDILAAQFGWPVGVERGLTVLLAFGLPVTLVLAWYHGEKGRQRVSGPELLMVAGILAVAGAAIAFVWDAPEVGTGAREGETVPGTTEFGGLEAEPAEVPVTSRSVAVLPLANQSPSEDHAWFAEAMTEEITTALSRVPELRVTSRSSASDFAESGMSIPEFAREIGVAHVIEGSVRRVDDQVRITIQLIDARTDVHVWSETYERELIDVLDVQVEIARQVADRLAASFSEREEERILAGTTGDPEAYDLLLRSAELDLEDSAELEEKIELLGRALERAKARTEALPDGPVAAYTRLEISAVRRDPARAVEALRRYVDAGGRRARLIRRDPIFEAVRSDSAFDAELVELERIVERQRARAEREASGAP